MTTSRFDEGLTVQRRLVLFGLIAVLVLATMTATAQRASAGDVWTHFTAGGANGVTYDGNGNGAPEYVYLDTNPSRQGYEVLIYDTDENGVLEWIGFDFVGSSHRETWLQPYAGGSLVHVDSDESGAYETQIFDGSLDGVIDWVRIDTDCDGRADSSWMRPTALGSVWCGSTAASSTSGGPATTSSTSGGPAVDLGMQAAQMMLEFSQGSFGTIWTEPYSYGFTGG